VAVLLNVVEGSLETGALVAVGCEGLEVDSTTMLAVGAGAAAMLSCLASSATVISNFFTN
jgi:ornithine cyclodeaminase/alanine dehydrogenase-like protein (mu-crystallin family)